MAGSVCWLARSTRPDLSFEVSMAQQSLSAATWDTVRVASNMVRRARRGEMDYVIPALGLSRLEIVVFSDASPGKMPLSGSQGGYVLYVA